MKMTDVNKKIILGSAQFGMDYGITNHRGSIDDDDLVELLSYCHSKGAAYIDTAPSYGNAETRLGHHATPLGFDYITKTRHFDHNIDQAADLIKRDFENSLERLQRSEISALLVHREQDLCSDYGDEIWASMSKLKGEGLCQKIGVSVYDPYSLKNLCQRYELDIVQIPVNIFDQRFIEHGLLHELKSRHIELHCRSVFLQGICLQADPKLPPQLDILSQLQRSLSHTAKSQNYSLMALALGFLRLQAELNYYVLGMQNINEAEEIFANLNTSPPAINYQDYAQNQLELLDPRCWPPQNPAESHAS